MEKVRFETSDGKKLAGILQTPGKHNDKGVVISHGFTGHKDANFIPDLARDIVNAGYPVLRFDFRGNGDSDGKFEEGTWTGFSEDLRSAVKFLKSMGIHRVRVIGFSMGGAVSIITFSKYRNFEKLVLIAPAIRPATDIFIKMAWKQLKKRDFVEFEDARGRLWRLNRSYFEDRERYDLLEIGRRIVLPILVIIGDGDRAVSIDAVRDFCMQDPERRKLVIVPQEDHVFHNSSKNLSPHILPFLS